jgi:hypothetical protein
MSLSSLLRGRRATACIGCVAIAAAALYMAFQPAWF